MARVYQHDAEGGVIIYEDGREVGRADARGAAALIASLPEPPAPVPTSVSLSDFLWAATVAGVLTQAEALASARTGDIPASLEAAVLAGADEAEQFEVRLMWAAMYEAERGSPFWAVVKAKTGGAISDEVLDGVFRLAGQRREMIAARK